MKDSTIVAIGALLIMVFIGFPLSGWMLMTLWNSALVPLAGVQIIGFWQSIGIVALLTFVGNFFKK